jgi:hypothetical protein
LLFKKATIMHFLQAIILGVVEGSPGISLSDIPGLPAMVVVALIEKMTPRAVGISVALPTQIRDVMEIAALVQKRLASRRPIVAMGGTPIREGLVLRLEFNEQALANVMDFASSLGGTSP